MCPKRFFDEYKWLFMHGALFLGMMYVMRSTAAAVATLSGGSGIIDLTFGITAAGAARGLSALSEKGAVIYRYVFLSVDMVYALCYFGFYRCAVRTFMKKAGVKEGTVKLLTVLPIAGAVCDLLENTVIFIMLGSAGISGTLCVAFSVLCMGKFIFVYTSLLTSIGGLLCLIKKRLL